MRQETLRSVEKFTIVVAWSIYVCLLKAVIKKYALRLPCHAFLPGKNMFLQCMAVFDVQKLSNKSKKKSKKYSQILKAGMCVNVKQKNSVTFRAES